MSAETMQWLNRMTLIGFTSKRGNAWHYRAEEQDGQGNHFDGAIPRERVMALMALPNLTEASVAVSYLGPDGVTTLHPADRKAIVRPVGAFGQDDHGGVLGLFKDGFQIHHYPEWLVENLDVILDVPSSDLGISSAGLLKGGAVAWVQVEMPETITTPEGVAFRPFLSAATSVDGSLSSTYMTGAQIVVCDNTLAAGLAEKDAGKVKVKHSRKSLGRLSDVRDSLGIVHTAADSFAAEVKALCEIPVSDAQFRTFLTETVGDVKDQKLTERSRGMVERRTGEMLNLWKFDARVAPWTGTAYGVLAAVNTYAHHLGTVRGTDRVERNMLKAVTGEFAKLDSDTIGRVLALTS